MAEDDPIEEGNFLSFLRWIPGSWSLAKLSQRSRTDQNDLGKYEKGLKKPRPATFEQIRSTVGVPQRLIPFLRWCHRLIRRALALGRAAEGPPSSSPDLEKIRAVASDAVDRALALARAERAMQRLAPPRTGPPTERDWERVEALAVKLMGYPEAKQRFLIQEGRAYRDPLLCLRICRKSEDAAADSPAEALKLAELALLVARHVDAEAEPNLQAWATGFVANAQRVGNDLPLSEATFARAWRLWKPGVDTAELLSEAYLHDMEASLRRAQRLFPRALKLHDRAREKARPGEVGSILLNKSATLEVKGDYEGSIRALEQATEHIDGECQPRLRFGLRFNQSANLVRLGRAADADLILPEVRELAERLGNDLDLWRTRYLEGTCAAGLGRREEAHTALEEVRQAFLKRNLPFDYALASLDHALLFREEERFAEIKALAAEMVKIFEAQQVDREALAAVILFQEAAEKEQVTAEMVKRLADYLRRAQREPGAQFER